MKSIANFNVNFTHLCEKLLHSIETFEKNQLEKGALLYIGVIGPVCTTEFPQSAAMILRNRRNSVSLSRKAIIILRSTFTWMCRCVVMLDQFTPMA